MSVSVMKPYRNFIVKIDQKYQDTFVTKGGIELYGDRKLSPKRMATTRVHVVATPATYSGEIKPGYDLFIDPTIVFMQAYQKTGEQDSRYLVDRENNLYRVPMSMVIAYVEKKGGHWKPYGENVLLEREDHHEDFKTKLAIPDSAKSPMKGFGAIWLAPDETGLSLGDKVYFDERYAVDMYMYNREMVWVRTKDLLAVTKDAA